MIDVYLQLLKGIERKYSTYNDRSRKETKSIKTVNDIHFPDIGGNIWKKFKLI